MRIGSVAQLNRASDYGSEGCGFESRRNHKKKSSVERLLLFFVFYVMKKSDAGMKPANPV